MTESIGNLYTTALPALSDTADIQEAFRIYHYGAPSGSGVGQYAPSNTSPANLVPNSIAYNLYHLQDQIDGFVAGILPTAWTGKGTLISSVSAGDTLAIPLGSDEQVLTVNNATSTGIQWRAPAVTLTNTVELSNKILTSSSISDPGLKFNGPVGNAYTVLLGTIAPTANRVVSLPDATTTLVGVDTAQTLTNKTISLASSVLGGTNTFQGALPVASGGTGGTTAALGRSGLEIFNAQTAVTAGVDRTPYSGKIFVADPTIVGATGANIEGAATGDLWFW
jgi:hypothetical protein